MGKKGKKLLTEYKGWRNIVKETKNKNQGDNY